MSEYQEFTGKTVEEALKFAREAFDVGLDDLSQEALLAVGELDFHRLQAF